MDTPYFYEIRVEGSLTERWADWFDGLAIRNEPGGVTLLAGQVNDQAALFGILYSLQALNLALISIHRCPAG